MLSNLIQSKNMKKTNEKYRAASWWITWDDLKWPDDDVTDKFKRRADAAVSAGVNAAVIYGSHFRWDFMPLWMNLHDMIAFIRNELHERGIKLFDHHSSVLTHRYDTIEEAQAMRTFNRHHLPFAPSRDVGSTWTYKGKKLNDWRMIDLTTGKPVFLKQYTAEQFCMNNPDFQNAYYDYVKRLLQDTNIDGLMSDDGIFYSGWTSCGCEWCRKKFKTNYGHEVPSIEDTSFWGNYRNEAFKDWIEMRFASTREFLEGVRKVTGPDYPLMACCSDSVGQYLPGYGMTYQEFIKPCNHIMLEMCGNTPTMNGDWHRHFPDQVLHLGLGRENNAPCFGLGYGFTEVTADFIWAFNKFLGADTWFSTLKGRLGLPDSKMTSLKDDSELCGNGFNWEKNHIALFDAETDTGIAVFYSRWSRDFYGMTSCDYVEDYTKTCSYLMEKNITFDAVSVIPEANKYKALILSGTSCFAADEIEALNKYLRDGGTVIASGPVGIYDKRGNKIEQTWLRQFGVTCDIDEPERIAAFPPCSKQASVVPSVNGSYQGRKVKSDEWIKNGNVYWTPGRMQTDSQELAIENLIDKIIVPEIKFPINTGWKFRTFKKADSTIIHALAESFDIGCIDALEKERKGNKGNSLINSITKKEATASDFSLHLTGNYKTATFYAPLQGIQKQIKIENGTINIKIEKEVYYFILELQ